MDFERKRRHISDHLVSMNRRNLLQAAGLALLSLVPLKLLMEDPKEPKYYLGYNEPYDRSLVRIFRQSIGDWRAELFYEHIPGSAPLMMSVNLMEYDPEKIHHVMQLNLERHKLHGVTNDILGYDEATDSLINWTKQRHIDSPPQLRRYVV